MDRVQEQNLEKAFFTVVIVVNGFEHLLSMTLDSLLMQNMKDFQIVIVESHEFSKIEHILQSYSGIPIELHVENEDNRAVLMNRGLGYAKGRYVHYLYSGDVYLSQHSLAYLKEMIEQNQDPDLLYCGYIVREKETLPSVMIKTLSVEMIRRGELPTIWQCWWFSKNMLQAQQGFNERFSDRPILDLVSKLIKSDSKIVFIPRILVDYVFYRKVARMSLSYMGQTYKVIYRHFGVLRAFLWWFLQDHVRTVKLTFRILKKAFWGT